MFGTLLVAESPSLWEGVFLPSQGSEALTRIATNCTSPYGVQVGRSCVVAYEDKPVIRKVMRFPYLDLIMVARSTTTPYGDLLKLGWSHQVPFNMVASCAAQNTVAFDVLNYDPLAVSHSSRYALNQGSIQSAAGIPVMVVNGERVGITGATMSCDEQSPFWICTAELSNVGDYARLSVRDPFSFDIGELKLSFVIDGKSFHRALTDKGMTERPTISGLSPLALLDTPFAQGVSANYYVPTSARSVVQDQIGQVDWELPDWVVPVEALSFHNSTPLAIARSVVSSIGGLIESAPDGTPVCRRMHPVNVSDYATTTPDYILFDVDIVSVSERISPSEGFNRVSITNDISRAYVGDNDVMDFDKVEGEPHKRVVRAYLTDLRPVRLVHTGTPTTRIDSLGLRRRTESERVEFVDGKARTRYKVAALVSQTWKAVDLGGISFSGNDLQSGIPDYSLVDVVYAVDSVDFLVASEDLDEVQFYLMDA